MNRSDQAAVDPINPRIEDVLRYASAIGATLLVLLPAARGSSEMIGWLPLWLLVMPLSAWWVLRRARPETRRKRQGRSAWFPASARHG